MKRITILLLSAVSVQLSAFGQGPLTPPGAPAPMMKTLQQVEPRTPITNTTAVTISASGSYYLTTNITVAAGDAITITANGVTLDLNGFTIFSTAPSATGNGILLNGSASNITIVNGHIVSGVTYSGGFFSGSGFQTGIEYPLAGPPPVNIRVSGISVSGCSSYGIDLGLNGSTMVDSCVVHTMGQVGILASTITRSEALNCGSYGMFGRQVSDCRGESVGSASGVYASGTAQNCYGSSDSGEGISAKTAANCNGFSNNSQGIKAETASNCYGESASNRGVFADVAIACSGRSNGSSYGVFATSVANTCYGFSQSGTGVNALIAIGCTGSSVSYTYHYNMPPSPQTP